MYRSARVWLSFIAIPALALARDVIALLAEHLLFPSEEIRLRRRERRQQIVAEMPEVSTGAGSLLPFPLCPVRWFYLFTFA